MMSQPKLISAGQVENYHKKKHLHDNYFNEGSGKWSGEMTTHFNLPDEINDKDFSKQLEKNESVRTYEFKIYFNKSLTSIIKNNDSLQKNISKNLKIFINNQIKNNDIFNSKYTDQFNNPLKIISIKDDITISYSKKTERLFVSVNSNVVHPSNWKTIEKHFKNEEFVSKAIAQTSEILKENKIKFSESDISYNTIKHRGRVGLDIVSSVPKSCSIVMWYDDKHHRDITDSMEIANKKVLEYIEKELVQVGTKKNYVKTMENSEKFLCASFPHYQSRNNDPYYHIHNIIFNTSKDSDGNIKVIENNNIYKYQTLIRHMHSNIFYKEMVDKGYPFRFTNQKKNIFELAYVSDEIIDYCSKSSKQMKENAELYNIDLDKNDNIDQVLKKYKPKKKRLPMSEQIPIWKQDLDSLFNFTSSSLHPDKYSAKKLDSISLKLQQEKFFKKLEDRFNSHFFFFTDIDYKEFCLSEGTELLIDKELTDLRFQSDIKSGNIIKVKIDNEIYFMTKKTFDRQANIFKSINKGKGNSFSFDLHEISLFLKNYISEKQNKNDAYNINHEQIETIKFIINSSDQQIAVQGDPGVGKSFTSKVVSDFYESNGYNVKGLAFVGKVVDTMKQKGLKNSSTIHSFLFSLQKESKERRGIKIVDTYNKNINEKIDFDFDGLYPSSQKEVWIVDETSMIDNNLLFNLQRASEILGTKIIYIGDRKQLNPCGPGYSFFSMIESKNISYTEMKLNQRQKNTIPEIRKLIKLLSIDILSDKELKEYKQLFFKLRENKYLKNIENESKRISEISKKFSFIKPNEIFDSAVLTATNEEKEDLNNQIRSELQKKGKVNSKNIEIQTQQFRKDISILEELHFESLEISEINKKYFETVKKNFSLKDKIMFLKNDSSLGVNNGTIGIIKEISATALKVEVQMDDEFVTKSIPLDKYNYITHGYAYTTHKAQSTTLKNVIINHNSSNSKMNNKNSFYVNISRTSKNLHIYTDNYSKLIKQSQISEYTPNIDDIDMQLDPLGYKLAKLENMSKNFAIILENANKSYSRFIDAGNQKDFDNAQSFYKSFIEGHQLSMYKQKLSHDFIDTELKELIEIFVPEKMQKDMVAQLNLKVNKSHAISL